MDNNIIVINDKKITWDIYPGIVSVEATIYEVSEVFSKPVKVRMIYNTFGNIFRKPNSDDYLRARQWIDLQIECIIKANTK